jgi:hypothetical protein
VEGEMFQASRREKVPSNSKSMSVDYKRRTFQERKLKPKAP